MNNPKLLLNQIKNVVKKLTALHIQTNIYIYESILQNKFISWTHKTYSIKVYQILNCKYFILILVLYFSVLYIPPGWGFPDTLPGPDGETYVGCKRSLPASSKYFFVFPWCSFYRLTWRGSVVCFKMSVRGCASAFKGSPVDPSAGPSDISYPCQFLWRPTSWYSCHHLFLLFSNI